MDANRKTKRSWDACWMSPRGCLAPACPQPGGAQPPFPSEAGGDDARGGQRPSPPWSEVGWVCECRLIPVGPRGWGPFAAAWGGPRPGPGGTGSAAPPVPPARRPRRERPPRAHRNLPAAALCKWELCPRPGGVCVSNATSLLLGEY